MLQVFFSYARSDADATDRFVDRLRTALDAASLASNIWIDREAIEACAKWPQRCRDALAASHLLLAWHTPAYAASTYCQQELRLAWIAAHAVAADGEPLERVLLLNAAGKNAYLALGTLAEQNFPPVSEESAWPAAIEAVLSRLRALDAGAAAFGAEPINAAPTFYGDALYTSDRFLGRDRELWKIHQALNPQSIQQDALRPSAVIAHGFGGIGKTLLAHHYARDFAPAYAAGVFLLRAYGFADEKTQSNAKAGGRDSLHAQWREIAAQLGLVAGQDYDPKEIVTLRAAIRRQLDAQRAPYLWLVDDLPAGLSPEALADWSAPSAHGRTLFTSRSSEYNSNGATPIPIEELSPQAAFELLTQRFAALSEVQAAAARKLAEDLGHHALALDVAGQFLVRDADDFAPLDAELASNDNRLDQMVASLPPGQLPTGHERFIIGTLLRSWQALGEGSSGNAWLGDDARWLLRLAIVLAPGVGIAERLAGAAFLVVHDADPDAAPALQLAVRWRAAFAELQRHGLIQTGRDEHKESTAGAPPAEFQLHDLMRYMVPRCDPLFTQQISALRMAAAAALAQGLPADNSITRHQHLVREFKHASHLLPDLDDSLTAAHLAAWLGTYANHAADYPAARTRMEKALALCRRILGDEHPNTLTSMNNLAETLASQGDLAGARTLQELALAVRRRMLGNEHPDTLTSMNNLAGTLWAQDDLAAARALQEQVLAVSRRVLGDKHPNTLSSMNNLAATLKAQGDLAAARRLEELVLTVRRHVLGDEHPDTLTSMNNLAVTLGALGDLVAARALQERVLAVSRRVLGDEHPNTLRSMNNLATTLKAQGDLAAARTLEEQTLAARRRVLGDEHPDTLTSMNNLAVTLGALGDLVATRALQERVLAVSRRVLGDEHPDTSISAWNLFVALHDMNEAESARQVYAETLAWLVAADPDSLGADQRWIQSSLLALDLKAQLPVATDPQTPSIR